MIKFKSKAKWPDLGHGLGKMESEDIHDTREQAQAVCARLNRDGLGGEGEVFPTQTEVVEFEAHEIL